MDISSNDSKLDINQAESSNNVKEDKVKSDVTANKQVNTTSQSEVTPKKAMSPKHVQKKLLSEQKRQQKEKEREEREKKKQEEKEEKQRQKDEKLKQKLEKEEQKKKEREEKEEQKRKEREEKEELKKKEREEKEQKRKEKELREEQKRKEKEQEKLKKQQELDEKNKEKQKVEEQKQKAAAAFVNFFVPLKVGSSEEDKNVPVIANFKPFELKSDMRLAPNTRNCLNEEEKEKLIKHIDNQDSTEKYLSDIKNKSQVRKSGKTWPYDENSDDIVIVEDVNLGQSICAENPKTTKLRAKLLQFHDTIRPAYYGTWSKRSKVIRPRKPLAQELELFDYEVDSGEEWEEEEQGESITGSDNEEKEEVEDDYEVDNDVFVPHGHLSDDEIDDEEDKKLSPESHKAKLKLLKNEFDEEMKSKTQKIKPRVLGLYWMNNNAEKIDDLIHKHLQPFSIITNCPILIPKRKKFQVEKNTKNNFDSKLIPEFIKFVHLNQSKQKQIANDFISYITTKDSNADLSKRAVLKKLKNLASWTKCPEGALSGKQCWYVHAEIRKKYENEI